MIIAIGSHSRNTGKTSLVCALLSALPEAQWTALKISGHPHGSAAPYEIFRETDPAGPHDTSRYLRAGARRSLWLRSDPHHLGEALAVLDADVFLNGNTLVESNRMVEFRTPDLYVFLVNGAEPDFKESAPEFLARAGAIVVVGRAADLDLPPVPVFPVSQPGECPPELTGLIRARLRTTPPETR